MCISVFLQAVTNHVNGFSASTACVITLLPASVSDWKSSDSGRRMRVCADWRLFSCVWTNLSSENATAMKSRCKCCREISCHAVFDSACGCFLFLLLFFFCICGTGLKSRKQVDMCLKDHLLVSCRWKEAPGRQEEAVVWFFAFFFYQLVDLLWSKLSKCKKCLFRTSLAIWVSVHFADQEPIFVEQHSGGLWADRQGLLTAAHLLHGLGGVGVTQAVPEFRERLP